MIVRCDWNEKELKQIATGSGSTQARADVHYARVKYFNCPKRVFARWIEGRAFVLAYELASGDFRIIGLATVKEEQGKGLARKLLWISLRYAKENGFKKVTTVTKNARHFYEKAINATCVGKTEKGYVMEAELE